MESKPMISYEDFAKIEFKTGKVLEATAHPDADKLLVLKVDIGDKQLQLVAGIKATYTPESLIGKTVVVLTNLAPRPLRHPVAEHRDRHGADPLLRPGRRRATVRFP